MALPGVRTQNKSTCSLGGRILKCTWFPGEKQYGDKCMPPPPVQALGGRAPCGRTELQLPVGLGSSATTGPQDGTAVPHPGAQTASLATCTSAHPVVQGDSTCQSQEELKLVVNHQEVPIGKEHSCNWQIGKTVFDAQTNPQALAPRFARSAGGWSQSGAHQVQGL